MAQESNKNIGIHKIFLIGDTGKPNLHGKDEVLELLKNKLLESDKNSTVIFLGDNIYPNGLPSIQDEKRKLAEKRINKQLDILKEYKGSIYFISGNHDWNKGKGGGLEYVKRQEEYIQNYLGKSNIYLPPHGCPGPEEVFVNDGLKLIFINTQWWVQKGKTPIGLKDKCKAQSEDHFFNLLDEMLLRDKRKAIVIGHHPLYSKAMHGGVFSAKQHIFPLRFVHKHLYIPLPGAGSIYPLYRRFFGVVEDISYPPYRRMKKKLLSIFKKHKDLIYVSGHDHNLQYIKKSHQHYLISGSGSKAAYARRGKSSVFSFTVKGFLQLNLNQGNTLEILAWEANKFYPQGNLLYKNSIHTID
ncbi:MAG TPA: metallophosphoesterase [Cytophagales bacterium]|nr:metallophosphoesterase [Cytophagales bacterium]